MDAAEMEAMLQDSVTEIKPKLAYLDNRELDRMHRLEEQGRNRSTLLAAIDAAKLEPKRPTEAPTVLADDYAREFDLGRRARQSAIKVEDAPFDPASKQYAAWLAGYESVG
ncbi:hypothetical protein LZK98_11860 [Sphingomonas cannabina]|uniref:hypothetical protein n=1 Tax=Sphingomonas cannabina TaxID=2899123 RepID=UPI001F31DEDC|nr:hypothetical protein [Sphingomonas cannabina]UIJ43787.1 hypothetical protein LZK98_11860 [Sphingomonas cannabina]